MMLRRTVHVHQHTKFGDNISNGGRSIATLRFQNGGRPPSWILLQVKMTSGYVADCPVSMSTIMPNLVRISQTAAELLRFSDFQNGGRRRLGFRLILFSDQPRSLPGNLKLCLKFYVSPIYIFEDIAISILRNLA